MFQELLAVVRPSVLLIEEAAEILEPQAGPWRRQASFFFRGTPPGKEEKGEGETVFFRGPPFHLCDGLPTLETINFCKLGLQPSSRA